MPATVTHDFHEDTAVQSVTGSENLGFLLARSGAALAPLWWAHYADGLVEQIDPANGHPRPDPDPAVRTKRVSLPPTIQTQNGLFIKHGSKFSGLIRRAVQCQYSRGLETKFSHLWSKTHGIIEYPQERQVGATKGEEAELLATRRQWVIEISAQGVFAAPLAIGTDCRRCASDLSNYLPTVAQVQANPGWEQYAAELSLSWAFVNKNESGAVLRLMTAGEIAPAYANGGVWYPGMGWAFSGSGWAASNVVHRTIFDGVGGLPDYYETRLLDLAFSISFSGSALTLTAADGVAYANMTGHGFPEGALVSIFGAEPDDYNGAHIIRNVTPNSFEFSVASGIPSPASGTPQAANAGGDANLSASLTVGSAGRVTFRKNDLGTLWVPGSEQFTKWDGIRPFDYFNCSGVVHVFYDGEEKIVTSWSSQSSTVPLDQLLSPHPQSAALGGPLPDGVNPNTFWAGVTFGFHYWAGITEYIEPYYQDMAVQNPEHPCSRSFRPYVLASGHNYGSYTNLAWGFSGPFSHVVNAYARTRIETESHWAGGHNRDPGFDYYYNGGYIECGSSPPKGCAATFIFRSYNRIMTKTTATTNESASGSSALFLFPMDREAVGGVRRTSNSFATSNFAVSGHFRHSQIVFEHTVRTPGCQITNITYESAGLPFLGPNTNMGSTNSSSASKSFAIRASGGVSISGSVGVSPDLDAFIVYQEGVKETADSSIFYMGGGLYNGDPDLTPSDQTDNRVYSRDGETDLVGGFTQLPAGRTPLAFIGEV